MTALDNLCNMKNFFVYEYPPPEIKKGCDAFYTAYYDILERELINRKDNDSIEDRICNKVTKACEGVDFEALRQEKLKKQKEEVEQRARGQFNSLKIYQKKEDKQREEEAERLKEQENAKEQEEKEKIELDQQFDDL